MVLANKNIFISIVFLSVINLIALYSVSLSFSDFFYVKRQALWILAGFSLMFLFVFFGDWRILKDNKLAAFYIFIISICLLVSVLFFPSVRQVKGWLSLGSFNFQPAEFAKLALIIVFAKYFSRRHIEIWRLRHIFISAIYLAIPAIFLLLQPDLGSIIILAAIWFFVLIISGIKPKHFLSIVLIIVIVAVVFWMYVLAHYQKERILTFLWPDVDPLGSGYQIAQSKIAIGSGGFFGRGLGKGIQTQYGFLPERHTDFIFASFSEEWGFLGILALVFLYCLLFTGLYKIGKGVKNNFSVFFVFGYAVMISSQIFINIGGNLGFLPITGISLPFLSYGGSNLLINFSGLGIILNMSRKTAFLAPIKTEGA